MNEDSYENIVVALEKILVRLDALEDKVEKLRLDLHEHKTNSHAKGCWF
jgi:hypothetical protein